MPTSKLTRGMSPAQRHTARIEKDPVTGCWNWTGSDQDSRGYSRFFVEGKRVLVHRWAYGHFIGPIPDGGTVHHRCENPKCSNPEHLEAMTLWENVQHSETNPIAMKARQTECIKGHSLDGAYVTPSTGFKKCRPCAAERERNRRAMKRAQLAG